MKAYKLQPTQVHILKALVKKPNGVTKEKLSESIGVAVTLDSMGPVFAESASSYPDSLVSQGYVSVKQYDGEPTKYYITSKGEKAAESFSAKKRISDSDKVPAQLLDRAVLKVRPTKSYGLERYTSEDIGEIKSHLGDEYKNLSTEVLVLQITNRRKQGAYANPAEKLARTVQSTIKAFGPEGEVIKGLLTPEQIKKMEKHVANFNKSE